MTTTTARRSPLLRALRDGAVVAGLIFTAYLFLIVAPSVGTFGFDAFAYWAVNSADPYQTGVGGLGAFNYTPPIARLFGPFGLIEWYSFLWIWTALLIGNVIWLGRRSIRVIWLLAFPPVALELYHGNIHLWIAAAIALGFRYPWTWAFVLLTKVTPGVGLLWFAIRREWRPLGIAAATTGVLVIFSAVLIPDTWRLWFVYLRDNAGMAPLVDSIAIPFWPRAVAAVLLVAFAARTNRAWLLAPATILAVPVIWPATFCLLLAIPKLRLEPRAMEPSKSTVGADVAPVTQATSDPPLDPAGR